MNNIDLLNKILETNPDYLPSNLNDYKKIFIEYEFIDNPLTRISLYKLKKGFYLNGRKNDKDTVDFVSFVVNNLPSFKQFKDDDNLFYLFKNNNKLMLELFIYAIYRPLSLASLCKRINSYIRLLYIIFKERNEIISHYLNMIYEIQMKLQDEWEEQKLNKYEKNTFIDFNEVLNIRQALEDVFNEGMKIDYETNQDLLLLSCYTLIPPNRSELVDLIYIDDFKDNDLVNDFIFFDNNNNEVKFILNREKKKHKPITINIEGHLKFLLKESFQLFPRPYLFTDYNDFNKSVNYDTIYKRFKQIFKFVNKKVSFNSLRSSYLTYMNKKGLNIKDKKLIAIAMRTSPKTIDNNYIKIL